MPDDQPRKKSRRRFLLGGLGVTGALIVGWGVMPPRQRLQTAEPLPVQAGEVALNGWIKVAADGTVTVAMPRSEMGQGVHTALPMLVAEEMDVSLAMVKIEQAPLDKIFGNIAVMVDGLPFHPDEHGVLRQSTEWVVSKLARELGVIITGGSSSVKDAWEPMREAGATARAALIAAAAKEWSVPAAECVTIDGVVSHGSGKSIGYGALATKAAAMDIGTVSLKSPKDFKLIGTPQPRRDSPPKVNGTAGFGLDVRPEGMVYAAVKMSPSFGGSVQSVDANAVKAMPGVVKIVDFSHAGSIAGVAVVAQTFYQAKQAAAALPVQWNAGPHAALSTESIFKELAAKLDSEDGHVYYQHGDLDAGKGAAKLVQAEYRAPFLAHATMEPINCTAQVVNGKVKLWASTQVPGFAVAAAAKVTKVHGDQVELQVTYLGGGFGRRLDVDMVTQAVAIAMETSGKPVQVIWTREEDVTHDVYRPAALARFHASLDANGNVLSYDNKSAGGSITQQYLARNYGLPPGGPDKTTAEGEFDMQYEFPNQRIAHVIVPTPVPLGYWRSVGHSHNAFFKESFVDELAHEAGKDPIEFRRALLKNHPRHLAVLNAAVEKAGHAEAGHALGVAVNQSFGTIVAEVVEVSVQGSDIVVHKVTCAVDCGIAVNPNIIAQQMESAVIFGLSAALYGEITIKDGKVEQQNFDGYPVVRMNQAPQVDVVIMPSAQYPSGVGEPGLPPLAPAVANAVFALTGKRLRSLPLRLS
jgi:isoquinoline 1-oxidoreductase beta subunit